VCLYSVEEIIDLAYLLIDNGLLYPRVLVVLLPLVVEGLALSLLVMESLSDLVDHILVETPLKLMNEVAAVLALLNEILQVLLGGLHIILLPVVEQLVKNLVFLGAEAGLLLSAALPLVVFVLDLLVDHLVLELLAGLILDDHLADNLSIYCLLISDHRVLEILGLSSLYVLFIAEFVLESLPGAVHGAGHLIGQFHLVGVVGSEVGPTGGRGDRQKVLCKLQGGGIQGMPDCLGILEDRV